ncbi:RICIN domain-containing protein [Planotetraspora sp. GP83]|uniref:RICIN domain-containing protein n=1 Tax=Planotetraspora sp. GP83 TaxID=3156264 RepID=UPI0035167441
MFTIPLTLKKITATVAAGALATACILAVAPGAAQASGFTVRLAPDSNQFLFLDVSGGSTGDGAKIIQWSLSGSNQGWTFRVTGDHYQIVNVKSGKCITTSGVAGDQLYQWVCTTDPRQLWDTGLNAGNGYGYAIRSVASGLYMDVSGDSRSQGAAIDTWYWNGGQNQYFTARIYS